ncbi:MAG TPA: hypothetical protein VGD99_12855 [Anaerolineae bacterium]
MTTDVHVREQRLRKQAELQSLYSNLANLRDTAEASYIQASAAIPERLINQINDVRREIALVEHQLLVLQDETVQTPGHEFYQQAFQAELAQNFDEALTLYKKAARYSYLDAHPAARSLRYLIKTSRSKSATPNVWVSLPAGKSRNRLLIGLASLLILALIVAFAVNSFSTQPRNVVSAEPAATTTPTPPVIIMIIPDTATPTAIPTATDTPIPAATIAPLPISTPEFTPTASPIPVPTLRAAPRVLEPKNGLVWGGGAVVFEFERLDLGFDELYCLNTLRGYDKTNTENWSFPPVGSKEPGIPIEEHVFRIAKVQGMRCIVWSAAIGKESCQNIISQTTDERVIGMPQPCSFK